MLCFRAEVNSHVASTSVRQLDRMLSDTSQGAGRPGFMCSSAAPLVLCVRVCVRHVRLAGRRSLYEHTCAGLNACLATSTMIARTTAVLETSGRLLHLYRLHCGCTRNLPEQWLRVQARNSIGIPSSPARSRSPCTLNQLLCQTETILAECECTFCISCGE